MSCMYGTETKPLWGLSLLVGLLEDLRRMALLNAQLLYPQCFKDDLICFVQRGVDLDPSQYQMLCQIGS